MSILTADQYAASFTTSLDLWDAVDPRSQQAELGISDIGVCHERSRRVLLGMPETDAPSTLAAMRGKAVDRVVKEARALTNPNLILKAEVRLRFPECSRIAGRPIVIPGHPDEIDPEEPSVTDYKTKDRDGYVAVMRHGQDQQTRWQGHNYYAGALGSGLITSEDGVVRNVFIDVSGHNPDPFVIQERFDPDVVHRADLWLSDSVYAARHGEEAYKDKWFDWCHDYCPFFSDCRRDQIGWVDDVITDPEVDDAAMRYHYAHSERLGHESVEKDARVVLDQYRPQNERMRAFTTASGYRVRHLWVNSQGGHWRLLVTAPKGTGGNGGEEAPAEA